MPEQSERVEELAQRLYDAWVMYDNHAHGLIAPKWFALRDDLKDAWRSAASGVLAVYDEVRADG